MMASCIGSVYASAGPSQKNGPRNITYSTDFTWLPCQWESSHNRGLGCSLDDPPSWFSNIFQVFMALLILDTTVESLSPNSIATDSKEPSYESHSDVFSLMKGWKIFNFHTFSLAPTDYRTPSREISCTMVYILPWKNLAQTLASIFRSYICKESIAKSMSFLGTKLQHLQVCNS